MGCTGRVQTVGSVYVKKAIVEIAAKCESVRSHVMCMARVMLLAPVNAMKDGKIKLAAHRFVHLTAAAMVFAQRSIYVNVTTVTRPLFVNIKFACQMKMAIYVISVVCVSLVTACVSLGGMGRLVKITNARLLRINMELFVI